MISSSGLAKVQRHGGSATVYANRTFLFVLGSFLAASLAGTATLSLFGTGIRGVTEALRVTGRVSFILFWPAYASSVLSRLNLPVLSAIPRLRREFGLGFAASHSVHAALILWLFQIAQHRPLPLSTLVFDSIGLVWVYTLAALSADHLRRMLKPQVWRFLFTVGLEWIALVFLSDFLILQLHRGGVFSLSYLPFTILLLLAAIPRWTYMLSGLGHRFAYQGSRSS